jgi:hypothetical protein
VHSFSSRGVSGIEHVESDKSPRTTNVVSEMGTKEALIYVVGSANRRGMDAPRANQREGRDTSNAFDDDESRALGNVSSIST